MIKNILITGAGKGIGKAIAEKLAVNNNLLLTSRTESDLSSLKNKLSKCNHHIDYVVADINEELDRKQLFDFAQKHFSPLGVLINNAGIYYKKRIHQVDISKIDALINTNVSSLIKLTNLFSRDMVSQKSGHIINISSVAGVAGYEGDSIYCASKFAVSGFSKALFEDLRPYHIRVSCIYPDFVNTWGAKQTPALLKPEDVATVVEMIINLPDYAVVQDVTITAIDKYQQT